MLSRTSRRNAGTEQSGSRGFGFAFGAAPASGRAPVTPQLARLSLSTSASTAGQFLLQVALGALIILVGEFADAIFELQVAQIFVDRGLALIQVMEGDTGSGSGRSLGLTPRMNAMTTIARSAG